MTKRALFVGSLLAMGAGMAGADPIKPNRIDPVTLGVRLDRTKVAVGTGKAVYLQAEIEVVGGDKPDRKPLALAIVLDVSGSMAGEKKLEHVIQATQYVVDRLGKDDRVSIVAYDSDKYEVYSPAKQPDSAAARRALAKLAPGSGTNMEAGLRLGLSKLKDLGVDGAVRRVLLLSDGQANEGVSSVEGLSKIAAGAREWKASVSTFGVGADYNEDLMAKIAEAAGGNYYQIDKGKELAEIFAKEFDELGSTVGTQAELRVQVPEGMKVTEVFGYPAKEERGVQRITLRDLFHGMKTKIVVKLEPGTGENGLARTVKAELYYREAKDGSEHEVEAQTAFTWVKDPALELASIDKDVVESVQEVESAKVLDLASREYERGNKQAALDLLQAQMGVNASVSSGVLGGKAEKLERQNAFMGEAMKRFSAEEAGGRDAKAAVKWSKQGARMMQY